MKEVWLDQRAKLQAIGVTAGLPPQGRRGTLSDALTIAEFLLLARSDKAVLGMFRSHPSQAASFLEVANGMDDVIATSVKDPSSSPVDAPYLGTNFNGRNLPSIRNHPWAEIPPPLLSRKLAHEKVSLPDAARRGFLVQ